MIVFIDFKFPMNMLSSFKRINSQEIQHFGNYCRQNKWLLKGHNPRLKSIFSKLSKHVHSVGPYLQTRHGSLSPKYYQSEFDSWLEVFKDVQRYVNILLVLGFPEKFEKMTVTEQNQILDIAIGADDKTPVKNACGI